MDANATFATGQPNHGSMVRSLLFDKDSLNLGGGDVGTAAQDPTGPAVGDKKPSLFIAIA